MSRGLTLASSAPVAGHPLWHFAVVAGAGAGVFAGIKFAEWWRGRSWRLARPPMAVLLLSGLALLSSAIHAAVCPEHFHEWVVYGVFFMAASGIQAAWSVLVLLRPCRRLFLDGAWGNAALVATFLVSRVVGLPFGPYAFQPEELNALGVAATATEVGVVLLGVWLARRHIPGRLGLIDLPGSHASRRAAIASSS